MTRHQFFTRAIASSIVAILLGSSMASVTLAQRWFNPGPDVGGVTDIPFGMGYYGALGGYGGGYSGGVNYGGGTVAGNYLSGLSQVIRSAGDYNEATSRSYINYEEARKGYIANRREWTDTYFALQEQNRARQLEKIARQKHSPEALASAAHSSVPRPLSSEMLDPISGRISWPEFLQRAEFAEARQRVDRAFELQAETSGAGVDRQAARTALAEMLETLRTNIDLVPANEYIANRKFLDSLYFSLVA